MVNHQWGEPTKVLGELPDVITGGDLIYSSEHHDALLDTLGEASAAHTQLFLAFRLRGRMMSGCVDLLLGLPHRTGFLLGISS